MLVVEIDVVDPEALERSIARLSHIVWVAANAEELALVSADVSKFRREYHAIPAIPNRAADELLIRERPVHVGRVEEVDPELDSAMDRRDRLRLGARAVELAHSHAAQ